MFDTLYNAKGLGCGCASPSPRLGFLKIGSCGSESAARDRQRDQKNATINALQVEKQVLADLQNGEQQAQFNLLKERIDNIAKEIPTLEAEKLQLIKTRDLWLTNPEVAATTGMGWGWFKRNITNPISRTISCTHYLDEENQLRIETEPFLRELEHLRGQLDAKKKELSPENMKIIQDDLHQRTQRRDLLLAENEALKKEIEGYKAQRNARIEAERLALEQAARDRELAAQKALEEQQQPKGGVGKIFVIGAIIFGGVLLLKGGKSKTTINVNK